MKGNFLVLTKCMHSWSAGLPACGEVGTLAICGSPICRGFSAYSQTNRNMKNKVSLAVYHSYPGSNTYHFCSHSSGENNCMWMKVGNEKIISSDNFT
jgi:hypothetical protein